MFEKCETKTNSLKKTVIRYCNRDGFLIPEYTEYGLPSSAIAIQKPNIVLFKSFYNQHAHVEVKNNFSPPEFVPVATNIKKNTSYSTIKEPI